MIQATRVRLYSELLWIVFVVCAAATLATTAAARQIDVPLQFDHEFIRRALLAQIYTGPDNKAVLWDDGTGCGFLKLREPTAKGVGNRLQVTTRGEARVGTPLGDQCLAPVQWDGYLEFFEEPVLSDDGRVLQFRVTESNIYDAEWKKGFFTGRIWDLVKDRVQPRFEAVRIDLNDAVAGLRDLLPLVVARGDTERIEQILGTLRLSNAYVSDSGVATTLSFAVNEVTPVAGPSPEPTLSAAELQRWEESWQRWDAFLTFVVKDFARDSGNPELRGTFRTILLDARYDLLEALAPTAPGEPDPTRGLFLKTWERLGPVLRQTVSTLPSTRALQYISFITAADALAALDQAGPDIGLDISADGLRRLARIVAPATTEDPLQYSMAVDPDLRQLLGFGAPLPPPDLSGAQEDAQAWLRRWFVLPQAFAADESPSAKVLARWLPDNDAIDAYLEAVREVLEEATQKTASGNSIEPAHLELYKHLVMATAWQESCWRQFIRTHGRITFMRSNIGSIGMMQVNERVWRGFYDVRGLRWDIRYNGRAGSEILLRYFEDYALDARARTHATPDQLARATYAVYNGGPGMARHFFAHSLNKGAQRIDNMFAQKFKAISAGDRSALVQCLVGG